MFNSNNNPSPWNIESIYGIITTDSDKNVLGGNDIIFYTDFVQCKCRNFNYDKVILEQVRSLS